MTLAPGIHRNIPMADYLALDALGSTHLSWLAISPQFYRYMKDSREHGETEATALGTAVHHAVLEPEVFAKFYVEEPDVEKIGGARPRLTNEYRLQVREQEEAGRVVLKADVLRKVRAMAASVHAHPWAVKVLNRAPERETTLVWDRDGRLCRGRADMLGPGILAELKTTKSLARFSPFELTKFRYPSQMMHYDDGMRRLGREIKTFMFIAVESSAPFDVAVMELDEAARIYGYDDCERLFKLLAECEASGVWRGQFPDLVTATITDALAAEVALADLEVA